MIFWILRSPDNVKHISAINSSHISSSEKVCGNFLNKFKIFSISLNLSKNHLNLFIFLAKIICFFGVVHKLFFKFTQILYIILINIYFFLLFFLVFLIFLFFTSKNYKIYRKDFVASILFTQSRLFFLFNSPFILIFAFLFSFS